MRSVRSCKVSNVRACACANHRANAPACVRACVGAVKLCKVVAYVRVCVYVCAREPGSPEHKHTHTHARKHACKHACERRDFDANIVKIDVCLMCVLSVQSLKRSHDGGGGTEACVRV